MGITSSLGCCWQSTQKSWLNTKANQEIKRVNKPFLALAKISSSNSRARHILGVHKASIHKILQEQINLITKSTLLKEITFPPLPSKAASKNSASPLLLVFSLHRMKFCIAQEVKQIIVIVSSGLEPMKLKSESQDISHYWRQDSRQHSSVMRCDMAE